MPAKQLAVITGGASGIGEATARRFAKDGYAVAILDQSKEAGEAGAKFINEAGGQARFYACDVADHVGLDRSPPPSRRTWGRPPCSSRPRG